MRCIVHYQNQCTYSKLKPLSDTNKAKIIKAKERREEFGGKNYHEEQCVLIPETFDDDDTHGIHLEACYKKYVLPIHCLDRKRLLSFNL